MSNTTGWRKTADARVMSDEQINTVRSNLDRLPVRATVEPGFTSEEIESALLTSCFAFSGL